MRKLLIVVLLVASCIQQPAIHIRQSLLYSEVDQAIFAGCVRGIARMIVMSGAPGPGLDFVHQQCEIVRRSFIREQREARDKHV